MTPPTTQNTAMICTRRMAVMPGWKRRKSPRMTQAMPQSRRRIQP